MRYSRNVGLGFETPREVSINLPCSNVYCSDMMILVDILRTDAFHLLLIYFTFIRSILIKIAFLLGDTFDLSTALSLLFIECQ